jgi:[lysine-biosynthesis-protein LysW]---L-2-aminoadipate ligase
VTQRVAMLMTRMRTDEKRIAVALEARGAVVEPIPDHTLVFDPHTDARGQYDVIVDRSLHLSRSRYVTTLFQAAGIPTVNTPAVINLCSNKLRQSTVLHEAGVPVPAVRIAFSPKAAVEAMEEIGYPVVLKPIIGTGGQLVSLIEDRDAAEAVLEHKATLGSAHHEVFYIEGYVPKPGRDLRATVVGGQVLSVEARSGGGWRIGANRHLKVEATDASTAIYDVAMRASRAIAGYVGGVLAVDILEHPERGPLVGEVNYAVEFRDTEEATGADIAGAIADYVLSAARRGAHLAGAGARE